MRVHHNIIIHNEWVITSKKKLLSSILIEKGCVLKTSQKCPGGPMKEKNFF